MERVRRLQQLWAWLPAFRAVAETEHLPSAAKQLGVTPSALSRTIKLLESDLELSLFDRHGRRLELNEDGRELLVSLRNAMRLLDDGVTRLHGTAFRGPLHIAAPGAFTSVLVVPMLAGLRERHPDVVPHITSATADRANAGLVDGSLDLVLLDDPAPHPQVLMEKLGEIEYGVYCGDAHPLSRRRKITPSQLADYPFVSPPPGGDDHWPTHWPRTIAAHVHQLHLGSEACARGGLLAVLPRMVADAYPGPGAIHRLPIDVPVDAALHVLRRKPLGPQPLLDEVVRELRLAVTSHCT